MEHTLVCPHCGASIPIDATEYDSIVKQVRDEVYQADLRQQESVYAQKIALAEQVAAARVREEYEGKLTSLNNQLHTQQMNHANAVSALRIESSESLRSKEQECGVLRGQLASVQSQHEREIAQMRDTHAQILKDKEEQIAYYKDFKARQSTKMVGESLERHCENQFNSVRAMAFPAAYFEKDNDIRTGSKGDFIFRDYVDGFEYISIMFEMKNEMDTTSMKHKNSDFFKELDKDRNEKGCEYAVLVSMLESDSELYNAGIVDVSHRYPKMYVIRPQFFLPLISVLRNAALNSIGYQQELERIRNQNLDVSRFEEKLSDFKDGFSRNYRLASERFQTAVDEIDKTIEHLEKVKKALLSSDNNLRLANNKLDNLSIDRLTKGNPTMIQMFEEVRKETKLSQ